MWNLAALWERRPSFAADPLTEREREDERQREKAMERERESDGKRVGVDCAWTVTGSAGGETGGEGG